MLQRDDNSPSSFERVLSKLAAQIQSTGAYLAVLRQRSRRYKALFTMYAVLGYVIYIVGLVLFIGHQNVGLQEGAAVVGAPVA